MNIQLSISGFKPYKSNKNETCYEHIFKAFIHPADELLSNGEAPIYLQITVNGIRTELAIFRSIQPDLWDTAKGRAKGNIRKIRELNANLDEYLSRLIECKRQLENDYRPVTAESLKNRLLGNDEINHQIKHQGQCLPIRSLKTSFRKTWRF